MIEDNKKPIRVLVNAPLGMDGITSMMVNIQTHIDRTKVNFDYLVIHDEKEPMEDRVLALGSRKMVASTDKVPSKILRRLARINEIRKVCKDNNIKIMHYNSDNASDVSNIVGARLGGVKYITIHSHNSWYGRSGMGTILASIILKPFMSCLCNTFWGCSESAARFLFPKSIIKSGNYQVIPNGIDLDKFDYDPEARMKIRQKLGIDGKFVIGHAGRFSQQKNHSFLIDVFKEVHSKDRNTVLLLFGEGELEDDIKNKVNSLNLSDSVRFCGTSTDMNLMYDAMDIFVLPSLFEGLPVVGVEAQASGLKCIFSDNITKEADINGNNIFLSLDLPEDKWAEKILESKDTERKSGRTALSNAGYDINHTAEVVSEFYSKLSYVLR